MCVTNLDSLLFDYCVWWCSFLIRTNVGTYILVAASTLGSWTGTHWTGLLNWHNYYYCQKKRVTQKAGPANVLPKHTFGFYTWCVGFIHSYRLRGMKGPALDWNAGMDYWNCFLDGLIFFPAPLATTPPTYLDGLIDSITKGPSRNFYPTEIRTRI